MRVLVLEIITTCVAVRVAGIISATNTAGHANNYALSVAVMTKLLRLEHRQIESLEGYADALQAKLHIIQLATGKMGMEHKKSSQGAEAYLSIPQNSFALLRRTHADWAKWLTYMRQEVGTPHVQSIDRMRPQMASTSDFRFAADAMQRIQETFKLKTTDMVNGYLNYKQYDAKSSMLDCLAMGEYLLKKRKFQLAKSWGEAAVRLYKSSDVQIYRALDVSLASIWLLIAKCNLQFGEHKMALSAIANAIRNSPNDTSLVQFQTGITDFMQYRKLCRSVKLPQSRLHCRYNKATSPFLKLAPLKMEVIAEDPYVVLYHNIIYGNEIKELQGIIRTRFNQNNISTDAATAEDTLHEFNLTVDQNETMARLDQRLGDMTGLQFGKDAKIQVTHFGLDRNSQDKFIDVTKQTYISQGQRDHLAGILYYLSDVRKGGDHIFPRINKRVSIRKGSALFWYNINSSGNENEKSLNAACPVISGSKWTILKFAKSNQQTLKSHVTENMDGLHFNIST